MVNMKVNKLLSGWIEYGSRWWMDLLIQMVDYRKLNNVRKWAINSVRNKIGKYYIIGQIIKYTDGTKHTTVFFIYYLIKL